MVGPVTQDEETDVEPEDEVVNVEAVVMMGVVRLERPQELAKPRLGLPL